MILLCKRIGAVGSLLVLSFLIYGCRHAICKIDNTYHYLPPDYKQVKLIAYQDTLKFRLGENVYNEIKSCNIFRDKGIEYISFYDRRSESINIYYLLDQRLCRTIPLKKFFKNQGIYKASIFIKNMDSIFIINKYTISLFDSSGFRKGKMEFPTEPSRNAAVFDSNKQPVLRENRLFAISRNRVDDRSLSALREWKIMYVFDLENKNIEIQYPLPVLYQENLYGYRFLEYNFCYNKNKKFVFSFPADTLLYETDLGDYNHSYFARSQSHLEPILPVDKKALENKQDLKEYSTRNSYGSLFYDPIKKYYLRLAKHKVAPEEFDAHKRPKKTVLILNEEFRIIGESIWPESLDFDSMLFMPDGGIYVRTMPKDEYTLRFVRFEYQYS